MATIEPNAAIAPLLDPDERLHTLRRGVMFELRERPGEATINQCGAGDLYLTSGRIVVLSSPMFGVELEWIQEIGLADNRLLLTLVDGSGLCLVVSGPQLLRVEISAAREWIRQARSTKSCEERVAGDSIQVPEAAGGLGPVADAELVEEAADVTLDSPR
jgi:hypothetical protein